MILNTESNRVTSSPQCFSMLLWGGFQGAHTLNPNPTTAIAQFTSAVNAMKFIRGQRFNHFRKFCRSIVGPPPYIDWTLAWHEILHTWNERAAHFVRVAKIESWSRMCCGSYWKLASHVVQRPTHHWIRRVLHWQPVGQRRLGRPKLCWESKLEMYCRYQVIGRWQHKTVNFGSKF